MGRRGPGKRALIVRRASSSPILKALLRLLPRQFREEQGDEVVRLFEDMREDWKRERGRVGAWFWANLAWDAVSGAAAEWSFVFRNTMRSIMAQAPGEHMSAWMGDIRYALRQLVRQPLYAVTIVVLMAVGVAGNAGMFRIFNGLFVRPLPFPEPEQLVDLDETAPDWGLEYVSIAYPDFAGWRENNRTFQSMALYQVRGWNMASEGTAKRVGVLRVTHDMDEVLRLAPVLGRFFRAEEDIPDAPLVGLLSMGFWEREFAGDPDVLGRTVSLDGQQVEIIGVLPPAAQFISDQDFWLPMQQSAGVDTGWSFRGIGRLGPGVTVEQARADLLAVHRGMIEARPANESTSPVVDSLRDRYLGDFRLGSVFLLGAVGIVLLIACANIAGLMLARGVARETEISVRLAMGAPRARIVRQLLTESALLAMIGGLIGTVLGGWASSLLIRPMAQRFPSWVTFDLDWRFVSFSLVLSGASVLLFGLVPALRASASKGGSQRRSTVSVERRRGMNLLVAGEVALALVLLVVGGLSSLDFWRLGQADPGFNPEHVMTYRVQLPWIRYGEPETRLAFVREYMEKLKAIPGVESATLANSLPLGGHWGGFYEAEGVEPEPGENRPVVLLRAVNPGYLETMGVPLLQGRGLTDFDGREEGNWAVVVNESFVRSHLEGTEDPIGRRIRPRGDSNTWRTIVGVTPDVRHYGVDQETRPGIYEPIWQLTTNFIQVALRTTGDPLEITAQARQVTAGIDPELPLYETRTMASIMEESLWTRQATAWIIAIFSGIALILAVAGLYGVISYSVGQRRKEISIRMALGAETAQVRRQVLRQGVGIVLVGVVIGLGGALAGARLISGILVGVSARDPAVYVGVTLLLIFVAAAANYLPARRAAALEPAGVLRED